MGRIQFANCMDSITESVQIRKKVNYGDRKSVSQFNKAYDRIVKMSIYIQKNYPERIGELISLIYHSDPMVAYTCACVFISHLEGLTVEKYDSLSVVKKLYSSGKLPPLSTLGLPITIEKWERQLGVIDK